MIWLSFIVLIISTVSVICRADFRGFELPSVFSSGMVLQHSSRVRVWGWGTPQRSVLLSGSWGKQANATVDGDGKWTTFIESGPPGGPFTLDVKSSNATITIDDVWLGEVWLASGQSNMEYPIRSWYGPVNNSEQEVAEANYPLIRLFHVHRNIDWTEHEDVRSSWMVCSSNVAAEWSAVAYFFARHLHRTLNVPVGIVHSSFGGSPIVAWMSREGLRHLDDYEDYESLLSKVPNIPLSHQLGSTLYNAMIAPIIHFSYKGVIWYQGESDVLAYKKYEKTFSTLIADWRRINGLQLPFYYVQIAPYNYGPHHKAGGLRDAQRKILHVVPDTGMVVTLDTNEDMRNIHPRNKQDVGKRLALWALAKTYGHDVVYSGPLPESFYFRNGSAFINFTHAHGGLVLRREGGFEVAGANEIYHSADLSIVGSVISAKNFKVRHPEYVRYAWNNTATATLFNGAGLPASSFCSSE